MKRRLKEAIDLVCLSSVDKEFHSGVSNRNKLIILVTWEKLAALQQKVLKDQE